MPTTLRDELRKAADRNRERPDWTKRRMPTITGHPGCCAECGRTGLFVGAGGFLTCPQHDCPKPWAPSEALGLNMMHDTKDES